MHDASVILDPWLYRMCVWCMCVWCGKFCSEPTDERTDKAILGVWCIHLCMMHPECMCSDIYIYDACVNDAHICDPGPWSWSSHLCMILDPDVCMYDAYSLDPDIRDYDAHCMMHLYMHVWCIYQFSLILVSDACVYDAHIYAGPWFWSKHVCIVHESMMRYFSITNGRTDERTNEQGDSRSRISYQLSSWHLFVTNPR